MTLTKIQWHVILLRLELNFKLGFKDNETTTLFLSRFEKEAGCKLRSLLKLSDLKDGKPTSQP